MGKALGWIDSHCHLTCADLIGEAQDVRQRALDAGVARMMIVCCRLEEAEAALKMKAEDARFDVAVGFHPSDLRDFTEEDWHKLETLVYNENVTAVGEIGLDYYWDKDNHPQQQAAFIRQIELANRVNKPILVHSRDAIGDTLALLREHPVTRRGIIHCFSSSREMAREFVKLGYMIGLGGPVTFKNAKTPKEVAADVDLAHLQIETDCPYLTPVPYLGKRNEPMYLPLTAKTIMELRGMEEEALKQSLWDNYQALFHPQDEL